jgi:hypothetical protein
VAISDHFAPLVDRGVIEARGALRALEPRAAGGAGRVLDGAGAAGLARACFQDGTDSAIDGCVFATGYGCTELGHILPADVLAGASYAPADGLQPLLLHLHTLHPTERSLGFAGVYRGPFFAVLELQARLLAALWAGARPPPSDAELLEGCQAACAVRDGETGHGRSQFPLDYVRHATALAAAIGVDLCAHGVADDEKTPPFSAALLSDAFRDGGGAAGADGVGGVGLDHDSDGLVGLGADLVDDGDAEAGRGGHEASPGLSVFLISPRGPSGNDQCGGGAPVPV